MPRASGSGPQPPNKLPSDARIGGGHARGAGPEQPPPRVFSTQLNLSRRIAVKTIVAALGALVVAGLLAAQPAQARCYWDGILGWQCTPESRPPMAPPPPACFPFWSFCR
jgi:hypothetical protein